MIRKVIFLAENFLQDDFEQKYISIFYKHKYNNLMLHQTQFPSTDPPLLLDFSPFVKNVARLVVWILFRLTEAPNLWNNFSGGCIFLRLEAYRTLFFGFYLGVSKNRDTPKWMVYNGKPYVQMDDLGVPLFLETTISVFFLFQAMYF